MISKSNNAKMSDMSSADEDALRRMHGKSRGNKPPTLSAVPHRESMEDLGVVANWLKLPMSEVPQLRTLRELVQEQKHLTEETDCKLAASKRITTAATAMDTESVSPVEVQQQHHQQSKIDPYQITAFLQRRSALPVPRFYCPDDRHHNLSQAELEQQLMENKLQLMCLDADFESTLLAEAGNRMDVHGVIRNFPVCRYKDNCVGSLIKIPGLDDKVQLTALMYPDEYAEFLKNGTVPRIARPCILCCRFILVDWDITCRELLMLGKQGHLRLSDDKAWHMQSTQVMQLYFNTLDRPGGYYSQYCVTPNPREPLLQPMVRLNRLLLRAFMFQVSPDLTAHIFKNFPNRVGTPFDTNFFHFGPQPFFTFLIFHFFFFLII